MPRNIHRSRTLMFHIVGRSQIGVSLRTAGHTVRFELADEQQRFAAALLVMDIALAGGRIIRRRALANGIGSH